MPTALYPQRSSLGPCFFQDLSCASSHIGHCISPTPGRWLKETGVHEGLELSPESDPQQYTAPTSTLALPSIILEAPRHTTPYQAPVTGALLPKVDSGMNKRMEKECFCEPIKKNAIYTKSEHIRAAQSGGERETMRQSLGPVLVSRLTGTHPIPAPPPPPPPSLFF